MIQFLKTAPVLKDETVYNMRTTILLRKEMATNPHHLHVHCTHHDTVSTHLFLAQYKHKHSYHGNGEWLVTCNLQVENEPC